MQDLNQKVAIYDKAVERFGSDVARFNKGVALMQKGDDAAAADAFAKVKTVDADLYNANGVIALHKGDLAAAANAFRAAGADHAFAKANMGAVDILNGNYAKAAEELADAPGCCNNTTLAYILTGQLDKAEAAIHCQDYPVQYLHAIIAARKGDAAGVKTYLEKASGSPKFADRAAKDIEFAAYR